MNSRRLSRCSSCAALTRAARLAASRSFPCFSESSIERSFSARSCFSIWSRSVSSAVFLRRSGVSRRFSNAAKRFDGERFDCGDKAGFIQANIAFSLARVDLRDQVKDFLAERLSTYRDAAQ